MPTRCTVPLEPCIIKKCANVLIFAFPFGGKYTLNYATPLAPWLDGPPTASLSVPEPESGRTT